MEPKVSFENPDTCRSAKLFLRFRALVAFCAFSSCLAPLLMFVQADNIIDDIGGSSAWVTMPRDVGNPAVCQITKNFTADACSDGWAESSDKGKCFKLYREKITFPVAVEACEKLSGVPACIASERQNEDIYALCGDASPCWIGLSKNPGWRWLDFTPLEFTNWETNDQLKREVEYDYVGIGSARWAESQTLHLRAIAGLVVVGTVLFCVCLSAVTWCSVRSFESMEEGKLFIGAVCDGCCACGCFLLFMIACSVVDEYPGVGTVLGMIFSAVLVVLVGVLSLWLLVLRGHMITELDELGEEGGDGPEPRFAWEEPCQPDVDVPNDGSNLEAGDCVIGKPVHARG